MSSCSCSMSRTLHRISSESSSWRNVRSLRAPVSSNMTPCLRPEPCMCVRDRRRSTSGNCLKSFDTAARAWLSAARCSAASRRARMALASRSGEQTHVRNLRLPKCVQQRSSLLSSVPCVVPLLFSRISRLHKVWPSMTSEPTRSPSKSRMYRKFFIDTSSSSSFSERRYHTQPPTADRVSFPPSLCTVCSTSGHCSTLV